MLHVGGYCGAGRSQVRDSELVRQCLSCGGSDVVICHIRTLTGTARESEPVSLVHGSDVGESHGW